MKQNDLEQLLKRDSTKRIDPIVNRLVESLDEINNRDLIGSYTQDEIIQVCQPFVKFYDDTLEIYRENSELKLNKSHVEKLYNLFESRVEEKRGIFNSIDENIAKIIVENFYNPFTKIVVDDEDYIGLFVSSLVNNLKIGEGKTSYVSLPSNDSIKYFGYKNTKNIRIEGDIGSNSFHYMKAGIVNITGNAKSGIGYELEGGQIIIRKDVKGSVGMNARGGHIRVRGDISGNYGNKVRG